MTEVPVQVRLDPDVVSSRVGDEMVLVHLKTDEVLSLNETAARAWDLVAGGLAWCDLLPRLLAEYEVEPQDLAREMEALLMSLEAHGLVRCERGSVEG